MLVEVLSTPNREWLVEARLDEVQPKNKFEFIRMAPKSNKEFTDYLLKREAEDWEFIGQVE